MRGALGTLTLLLGLAACSPDPGRVELHFSWGSEGAPTAPNAALFVRVSEVELDSGGVPVWAGARTIASAGPTPLRLGATLELPQVPNGDLRVAIVEVRESSTLESELLRYGVSAPFSVRAGETTSVEVTASLRRPPNGTIMVTGSSSGEARTRDPMTELTLSTTRGVRAELSNFETFPSETSSCFGLGRSIDGCALANPMGSDYRVAWDLNRGLLDRCPQGDRCPRRVFVRFYDETGVSSVLISVDITLDTRAPSIQRARLDYGADPSGVLSAVTAARLGSAVSVTWVASEAIDEPPPTLTATGPGAPIELRLLPTDPGELVFQYSTVLNDPTLADGDYLIAPIVLTDLAGNSAENEISVPALQVRVAPPELVVRQERLSYVRSAAKNSDPETFGSFTVPAGSSYFALAPADPLDGTDALPADTFEIGGVPATALRVYGDPARDSLLLPRVLPDADGTWPRSRLRLPNLDASRVYVTGLDAAGNESSPVEIGRTWYVRSSASPEGLSASDDPRWPRSSPLRWAPAPARDGVGVARTTHMAWRGRGAPEPPGMPLFHGIAWDHARGEAVMLGYFESLQTWTWDGYAFKNATPEVGTLDGFGDETLVYDAARSRAVAIGSAHRTWEWDGVTWSEVVTTRSPDAAFGGWTMAFDELRGVVVLFGGSGLEGMSDRTWIYDGVDWSDVSPPQGPPGRSYAAMTYDAARGCVLLFGGTSTSDPLTGEQEVLGDTWVWDGTSWTELTAEGDPSARTVPFLAYDATRERVVLQGGTPNQFELKGLFHDTWEWDGHTWVEVTQADPGPSVAHLFYDPVRERVLSWGGELEDQFEPGRVRMRSWDGQAWELVSSTVIPEIFTGMAYDFGRERMVALNERGTWEWDGALWTRTSTMVIPGVRAFEATAIAYDNARQQMVLFTSGTTSATHAYAKTWTYDGTWHEVASDGPRPRRDTSMAYDVARQRLILFGGRDLLDPWGPLLGDTWAWDGAHWTEIGSAPGRSSAAMTYDPIRDRVVRFSGYTEFSLDRSSPGGIRARALPDIWEWDGVAWTEVTPPETGPSGAESQSLLFDRRLGRVLVVRPGIEVWSWDGAHWADVSPTLGVLPAPLSAPVVFDPKTSAGLLSFPSIPSRGTTWSLESTIPAIQLTVDLPSDVAPVQKIVVRAFCGGHDPDSGDGARLLAWSGASWEELAHNQVGVDLSGDTGLTATLDRERFWSARDRRVFVQCRALGDAATAEVSADYVEVRVEYGAGR